MLFFIQADHFKRHAIRAFIKIVDVFVPGHTTDGFQLGNILLLIRFNIFLYYNTV